MLRENLKVPNRMLTPIQNSTTTISQPGSSRKYALMTAAHNEQTFIEKAIASVLRQTLLPVLWVIVSDGSTDKTDEIVERCTKPHEFIRFLKVTRAPGRSFGSKGAALLNARELLKPASFDF